MTGRFRQSPLTFVLIGMNVALFVAGFLLEIVGGDSLTARFALNRDGMGEGHWWLLITHAFLHGNLLHLVVNMVALWFTGPLLEALLGAVPYLFLYLSGAVVGGFLQVYASRDCMDLVGASGAVCALLAGFATLLPRLEITALIFFIIPVRMKAATLGWLVAIGSLLFWILGIDPGIGHLAHLGGAVDGFLLCLCYRRAGLVRLPPLLPEAFGRDQVE
jgi:membrane associated rhomboid family serine protease